MNVLYVTAELTGFAKYGGVADVSRDLPLALRALGHDVRIVIPYYGVIARSNAMPIALKSLQVAMGNSDVWCAVRESHLEGLPVYAIEHDGFYRRDRLYDDGRHGFVDNTDRFAYLCKSSLEVARQLSFRPGIVHGHDWPTALTAFFLRVHEWDGYFDQTASVLTIHNAFFQGKCWSDKLAFLGAPPDSFVPDIFEDHGEANLLKAGVYFADQINAVSPGYAAELLSPEGSHGLHFSFKRRAADFRGILNGCDYRLWNPQDDRFLPRSYTAADLKGKAVCKAELRRELGLQPEHIGRPLLGMVSRVVDQKGFEYLLPALHKALLDDLEVVVLGTGEPTIETEIWRLANKFPEKMVFLPAHNERMAHRIFAGSDFFLMPSQYEPCGLTAMYAMRYGAVPIVRAVGGLSDIVSDVDMDSGTGTGVQFRAPEATELAQAIRRAVQMWQDRTAFCGIVQRAMSEKFEWAEAARKYVDMFKAATLRRTQTKENPLYQGG